jgi:FtsH-binding integral membrane protein
MNIKKYLENRIRGWLPKELSLPSYQRIKMVDYHALQYLRLVYGIMLGALLVMPFGVYHSRSEPYITGYLWGYHLPIGYVGLLLGIVVVLYPRLNALRSSRFSSLMPFIGLSLLLSFYFSPNYYFINLLHGTSFSSFQIDVDFPLGNSAVVGLSLLSIALGLVSFLCYRYPRKQAINRKS